MTKPVLVISGISIIVTIFSVFAYLSFNLLGISQNRTQRYELTIVTESVEKVYDGTPLSSTVWYIEKGALVEEDTMEITMESVITSVGQIDNEIGVTILDKDLFDVTGNYKITLKVGKLTITPRPLTIQTETIEKIYDGLPIVSETWSITEGSLAPNHQVEALMTATITKPGSVLNTVGINIYDIDNKLVTSNYQINYSIGNLTVYPREIGIETTHVEKIYDGVLLSDPTWRLTYGFIPSNHRIEYVMSASITNPGSIENSIGITILDQDNTVVTDLYEIEYIIGSLIVHPRVLTFQTESADKVYDGRVLSSAVYYLVNGSLAPNHRLETIMTARITNPGSVINDIGITIFDQNNEIVTDRYQINTNLGTLTVYPRALSITTESQEKVYDGLPLVNQNWAIKAGNLADGHRIETHMVSSITDPGTIENNVGITIYDQDNNIVTNIYDLILELGYLTVTPRRLIIQTETLEKYFDGAPLTSRNYTILEGSLAPNHRIEEIMESSITNPGSIENFMSVTIFDINNQIVTSRYELQIIYGTLTILPIRIEIRTDSAQKVYDGSPLSQPAYVILNGAIAANHRLEAIMVASLTTPGLIDNTIGITIYDQNNLNVTIQYDLVIELGTLEVTKRRLVIETPNDSKVYDGTPLTNQNWILKEGLLAINQGINATMPMSITTPGSVDNSINLEIINSFNQLVTENYEIEYIIGELTVYRRELHITTGFGEKVFDGTPLTNPSWIVTQGSLLSNHYFEYSLLAEITLPGTIENNINLNIFDINQQLITDYYEIHYTIGTLTVHKIDLIIETETVSKVYDGQILTSGSWIIKSGYILNNHTYQVSMTSSILTPGQIYNDLSIHFFDYNQSNVDHIYNVILERGMLEITRRPLEITTDSASKMYDGSPLSYVNWWISNGTMLTEHRIEGSMFDNQTIPGVRQNGITIRIFDMYNQSVNDYYDITYNLGSLTVHRREIIIETDSANKVYDGSPLSNQSWQISNGYLVHTHNIYVSVISSITTPGSVENDFNIAIYNDLYEDVTAYYQIHKDLGRLTVSKRDLVIQTESDSKPYDGSPLTNPNWYFVSGQLVSNHSYNAYTTGSITLPGTVQNSLSLTIYGEEGIVTDYYNIIYQLGQLTVEKRVITVETESFTKVYDGNQLYLPNYQITSGSTLYGHHLSATMNTQIITPGSVSNEITVMIHDEYGIDITDRYQVEKRLGQLIVMKRDLIVTTEHKQKAYDGSALTSSIWSIQSGSLVNGHTDSGYMSSRITYPGSIDNELNYTIYSPEGYVVNNYYNITYVFGQLTILPREITIKTFGQTKMYDGFVLSNGQWDIISGDLVESDHIDVTMTASLTAPGRTPNMITVNITHPEHGQINHYYMINYVIGDLVITKRPITITTASLEKLYDGIPLFHYSYNITLGSIAATDSIIDVSMPSSQQYPGSTTNEIFIQIYNFSIGLFVTDYYDITYNLGILEVKPIEMTIKTESSTKVYDGTALTNPNWRIINGSLASGHVIDGVINQSITNPGIESNDINITIFDINGFDVTRYYNIKYEIGNLEVKPREITIKTDSSTKVYDGIELSNPIWQFYTGSLANGHTADTVMNTTLTIPGIKDNTIQFTIFDSSGKDVTSYYEITYIYGTLTVVPKPLTIETESASKEYDGYMLMNQNWRVVFGSLINGHLISPIMTETITLPGIVDNTIEIIIRDSNELDITQYYDINYELGTLEVKPRQLVIHTNSDSKVYDGTALFNTNFTIINGTLLPGHLMDPVMNVSITLPGETDNLIGITINDNDQNDVTNYYQFSFVYGKLIIHKREITVITDSAEKQYDGTPLTNPSYTIIEGTILAQHHVNVIMPSTITNPGLITNVIGFTILDQDNNDVSHLYIINKNEGSLEVLPIPLIISSGTSTKVYDGTPLTNPNYMLNHGQLLSGHQLFVETTGTITDIGQVENFMFVYVLDSNNNNVSHFYEFDENYGTLTILTSSFGSGDLSTENFEPSTAPAFKVYSPQRGTLYFKDTAWGSYKMTGWNTGIQHNVSINTNPHNFASSALEEAGRAEFGIQVEYLREQMPYLLPYFTTDPISGLNDIRVFGSTSGTITFNIINYTYNHLYPIALQSSTLQAQEQLYKQFVYNNYLSLPETTRLAMLDIIEDNNINALSPTIIKDVQNYIQNAATYNLDFDPIPSSVTDIGVYFLTVSKEGICQHYATAATLMYRALGIPARYVTGYVGKVKSNQWTTITDEYSHAWVEVYLDGFGWLPVEVTGAGQAGGGGGGGGGTDDGETVPELTVTPRPVREHYVTGKVITPNAVSIQGFSEYASKGYTYEFILSGSLAEPGVASSDVVSFIVYDALGNDVTYDFDITFKQGILQMYAYSIDLYTNSDTKVYDGTSLTNSGYYINGTLAPGHTVQMVNFTGTQTNVGTSKNRANLVIVDENGNNVTALYLVTGIFGDLTVTPRTIVVESSSNSKRFNGLPLTDPTYTISSGSLAPNQSIEVTITGSQSSIGSSINTIETVKITSAGIDVTLNYIIEIEEGILTVRP